jgi:uncharacterized protein YbjT (DUF2867 family)
MTGEQTVLVTGATGHVGGQVVAQVAGASGVRVRALSRDPVAASAAFGPGVELVGGDLAAPETLREALVGVDRPYCARFSKKAHLIACGTWRCRWCSPRAR